MIAFVDAIIDCSMKSQIFSRLPNEDQNAISEAEANSANKKSEVGSKAHCHCLSFTFLLISISLLALAIAIFVGDLTSSLQQERKQYISSIDNLTKQIEKLNRENLEQATETSRLLGNYSLLAKKVVSTQISISQIRQENDKIVKTAGQISPQYSSLEQKLTTQVNNLQKKIQQLATKPVQPIKQGEAQSNFKQEMNKMKTETEANTNKSKQQMQEFKQDLESNKQQLIKINQELLTLKQAISQIKNKSIQQIPAQKDKQQTSQNQQNKTDNQKSSGIPEQAVSLQANATKKNETVATLVTKYSIHLYNQTTLAKKAQHQKNKKQYIEQYRQSFIGLDLALYNFNLSQNKFQENFAHVSNMMPDLNSDAGKAPFCVIVPSYLNHPLYFFEYTLNSIFRQKYGPMLAVIFSSPREEINHFISNYLSIHNISNNRYVFEKTIGAAIENTWMAVNKLCQPKSIAVIVEGGNELLGKYALEVYNQFIKARGLGVVFSNYFLFNVGKWVDYGRTGNISPDEYKDYNFRRNKRAQLQLIAFSTDLAKKIKPEDLKNQEGKSFDAYIMPFIIPVFELSCGRALKIGGVYFLENIDSGIDNRISAEGLAFDDLAKRETYKCDVNFNKTAEENKQKRVYSPELEAISAAKIRQKPGMIDTPKGDVSLIDLLYKNQKGQRIEDIVCPFEYLKNSRRQRHKRRIEWTKNKINLNVNLAKYNLKLDNSLDELQKKEQEAEYQRLSAKYHFDKYTKELPICVIVPTLNNQAQSRFQYSLNAIFTQNYTNYFAVIINDASTDRSDFMYRSYLHFYKIPTDRYAYIENKERKTAMVNIYNAEVNFCSEDSITIISDGDDQILGKNAFKTYNAAYQGLKGGAIYSNYYYFVVNSRLEVGISKSYPQEVKQKLKFREMPPLFSHLRSYRTALFLSVDKKNFQDANGNFYKITCDFATYIPIMEKACGRVYYIDDFFYLYNSNTGMNDNTMDYWSQIGVANEIRKRPKLECLPEYKAIPFLTLN